MGLAGQTEWERGTSLAGQTSIYAEWEKALPVHVITVLTC